MALILTAGPLLVRYHPCAQTQTFAAEQPRSQAMPPNGTLLYPLKDLSLCIIYRAQDQPKH